MYRRRGSCCFQLVKTNWQLGQPSQSEIRSPNEWRRLEGPIGEPAQHQLEGSLPFDARERRAEAEVSRPTEGEMPVVAASDVQPIRIRKPLRISICRGHYGNYGLALTNSLSTKDRAFRSQPRGMLAGAFIAQQLLDC